LSQRLGRRDILGATMAELLEVPALRDRVVLVTGSSRGIGEGLIRAFAGCGARCVVNYVADPKGRNEADANRVAGDINAALVAECDVSDDASVARMFEQVQQSLGGLDVLVNNAGVLRDRTLKKMTPDDWQAVIQVNLTGTFNCIRYAQPILRPGGRVVNIASVSGQLGLFGQANYASSKAGIIALTKVAAREFARQQVTVNAVAPGFIDTEMSRTMPPEVAAKFVGQVPLGRVGAVEDVVNAVLFLCSPYAGYVTGHVLNVNGGFHMG
jgi:3-oxoacyl-[acyl-carrier protein] reductase